MEVIKGYKQTEIGVIPDDWNYKTINFLIKELTDFVAAGSFESLRNNVQVYDFENYALYVRLYDIRLGIGHDKQKYVDEQSYRFLNKSNLYGDEILMANIGANVGEAFLMPKTNMPATIAPNMIIIRSDEKKLISKYLFYYIVSNKGQKLLSELIAGSGHPKLNKTDLKKLNIIFPPSLKEQTAIANALSDTDTWINSLEQLLTKKRQIKQGAMQELLQPKEGWEVKTIKEVAKFRRGSFPQPYGLDKWYDDYNGMPFVQVYDVDDNKRLKTDTKRKISEEGSKFSVFVEKGSVILTIQGSIGRIAITQYDAYVDRTLLIFESYTVKFNKYFFVTMIELLFEKEKEKAPGGIIKTITKEALSSFEITFPDFEEQIRIASILSDMDEEITQLETKLAKVKQIKQGMMQELLTGRIRLVK